MSNKKYEMDLSQGALLPSMIKFTLPIIASSILQLLFNAADIIVVGRFDGDNALSAVGSNTALVNLLVTLFMGLSVGVNVLVANYYGGKKSRDVTETVHTSMLVAVCSGLLLTIVGTVFATQFLKMMNTPENILGLATTYLRIYFIGMIGNMLYNFGSSVLRAVGDTRRPLYYLLIAGVINVILNLIFVIAFKMGVAGVALATVISQYISAGLVVLCMIRDKSDIRLEISKLRINWSKFLMIIRIGLPASVQGLLFSLSNVIIQASVNGFGEVVVGGNTAAANIEGFVYVAMNALYQAAISFTSQNIGAGRRDRVVRIALTAEALVVAVGVLLGNLAYLFGNTLLSLYTDNPEMMVYGMDRISIICRSYALCGMMDVMVGVLRGMGYSIMPMFVSLVGACGLRLIWIFTYFQTEQFHSTFWLYITYPISWIVTLSAHVVCFMIVLRITRKRAALNG